ncbi:hypothetical protein PHYSODRAFT_306594 [Phytophthora sojae]|uniref:Uncharacterized protein n=1 Tax=Phytophthora sojae (strain P6497) TaxID=1094619 RepID=G5A9X8_PHYSP|nr:hypothetical protein PHYSODRAFT_306594 [Phytophthora sojae]EGZ07408.1 hypothetical protein PHYSODRAFT_306594 [Phytophthora sojae]|eukprot:XP_009536974.1 hypothetical protein PHYSODRAFT_306594 [Phytophthora sojae]
MPNEVSCERRSVTIKMEHNLADQLNCMEATHKLELQCMVQRHEESSRALELARADTCKLRKELAGIREQVSRVRRLFEQEGAAQNVALQQIKASRRRTTGLLAVLNGALGGRAAVPVKKEVPEQTGTRFQLVTDAEEEKTADINQTLSQKRMTQGKSIKNPHPKRAVRISLRLYIHNNVTSIFPWTLILFECKVRCWTQRGH